MANKLTKKELLEDAEILLAQAMPIFNDFAGENLGKNEGSIEVKKKDGELIEKIEISCPPGLCYFGIEKHYNVKYTNQDERWSGPDSYLRIIIRWFDWDDDLTYETSYYPEMDTELVIEKLKIFAKAAENSAVAYHKYRQRRYN